MGIPYPYDIETLSIYRDRDLRQRPERDKTEKKTLRPLTCH